MTERHDPQTQALIDLHNFLCGRLTPEARANMTKALLDRFNHNSGVIGHEVRAWPRDADYFELRAPSKDWLRVVPVALLPSMIAKQERDTEQYNEAARLHGFPEKRL